VDKFIEERYLDEIIKQADRALSCAVAIEASLKKKPPEYVEDVFRELEHFIQHASAISLFLWNNSKKCRCCYLKDKLKVDENILSNRDLRNHLVHFDTRLGKWAEDSKSHNFIDQNIGNIQNMIAGVKQDDCIRNYDPNNNTYTFCGQSFNIQDITQEVEKIKESAQARKADLSGQKL